MALLSKFEQITMSRNSIHEEIESTYSVFEHDGQKFIQIDSYGRPERKIPGKKSQTFQLDKKGGRLLFDILNDTFHFK
ncbi:methionyl-tRNA formyltransferase [Methylocapsa palsarum]|uniref:Methionyl-tRNA formyltransferase n=1 Tax=Methylocapsa palsarum TaxID=1612308 RepID=A0A1I3ZN08_9HYPH|nr:methionyl-tRNA formyltransferase [Methylocapsa palsarum]SFK45026.1 hypothetical protein SAMN05444581_10842 [Methylocapsa palsarum]